jgi:hypothetical protein
LTAPDDIVASTRSLDEDGHGFLRGSARKIDRDRIDSSTPEAHDIGLHRCRVAGRSMTEDDTHASIVAASMTSMMEVDEQRVLQKFPQPLAKKFFTRD